MSKIVAFVEKYWPEVVTASVWGWTQFGPALTSYIQGHPKIATDIAAVAVFLARAAGSSAGKAAE